MPAQKVKVAGAEEAKKEEAWNRLMKLLDERREKAKHITVEEAERDALEMVRRVREKKYAKAKKPSQT